MTDHDRQAPDQVDGEPVTGVEEATNPLTPDEVKAAQQRDQASGEAVAEVNEATDPLTPDEVREAQERERS